MLTGILWCDIINTLQIKIYSFIYWIKIKAFVQYLLLYFITDVENKSTEQFHLLK